MKRIWAVALLVLVVLLLFDLKVLSSHEWSPRAFILERSPDVPLERGWGIGYDGQWYYAIAMDPLNAAPDLDVPAYRYQRIFYPLLVWTLSLGHAGWVPWTMLAVNLASAVIGTAVFGALLLERRVSPWWALVFFFSLGYLLTIRLNLLEPLTLTLALGGWLAYEKDRRSLAITLFALAGLTKEFGLVFPAGLVIWLAGSRLWRQTVSVAIGSFAPYLFWKFLLLLLLGVTEKGITQSTPLLIPFWGVRALTDYPSRVVVGIWVLLPAIFGGLWAVQEIWRQRGTQKNLDAVLVLTQAVFVAVMPELTWADPIAVLRVALGLLVAILLWLASTHRRMLPYAAALWAPTGMILFLLPGMV